MKRIIFIIVYILSGHLVIAQDSIQFEKDLRQIADVVVHDNIRGFVDYKTGKVYNSAANLNPFSEIWFINHLSRWEYHNGVVNIGMLELGEVLNDRRDIDYSLKNYDFIFNNSPYFKGKANGRNKWSYPFGQMFVFEQLDDCGAMGASIIDVYHLRERNDALDYINNAADFMINDMYRLDDGTYCRDFPTDKTIWGDDLYMSVPFLARMGNLTGERKYFDEAVKQVLLFTKYLWDEHAQLYYHGWYSDIEKHSVAHWSRVNGWIIMAQVELLKFLPKNHPGWEKVKNNLIRQILGVAGYQSKSGHWHQLLDKEDSYLETSGTAMFTYAIAFAVNQGILPARYITIAGNGWKGLMSASDRGTINQNCMGTGIQDDLNYYYTRAQRQNDVGFGAVILAGVELLKYTREHGEIRIEKRGP